MLVIASVRLESSRCAARRGLSLFRRSAFGRTVPEDLLQPAKQSDDAGEELRHRTAASGYRRAFVTGFGYNLQFPAARGS